MKVKGLLKDLTGASRVTKARKSALENASTEVRTNNNAGHVAYLLHHGFQKLVVSEVREASKTARTIRFTSDVHLPYFKAGQFLTIRAKIGNSLVTRPYSISSAPVDTRGENPFVEITVRKSKGDGFFCDFLYDIAVGTELEGEVGLGQFYYDSIRDARNVVALAGGSGITPFASMAREIKFGKLDMNLTILYGSVSEDDIILQKELEECVCDKVKVVHVLSGENPSWTGEKGFINRDIIKKYSAEDTTYFVCGPQVMYEFIRNELDALEVPARRIRFEVFGQPRDLSKLKGYDLSNKDKVFTLKVLRGVKEDFIEARGDESIATALERAGIKIHTACRSGACGFCRLQVLKGTYFVPEEGDGRRGADKDFNYVHACSTYPTSDLTIQVNI